MPKVLIPTKLDKFAADLLTQRGYETILDGATPMEELIKQHSDAEALIVRSETDYFYPRMIEAYYEVLADSGMSGNRNALVVMSQSFELGAYLACRDLLKRACRPTAIIASRDYQACGVYQACMAQNLLPGRDISIISYDDIGWSAGREILTTYSEPCEELGAAAVDILHDMLSGNGGPRHREAVPVLQMRRTLAPIPLDRA